MRFKTASGSEYEVKYTDSKGTLVRRISSPNEATLRQAADGVWQKVMGLYPEEPIVGQVMLFHWKMNGDGSMNCTQTSPVTKVEV